MDGQKVVTLTILFNPVTGEVNVNGPIANKLLCYGLLKAAELAIVDAKMEDDGPRIIPAVAVPEFRGHG